MEHVETSDGVLIPVVGPVAPTAAGGPDVYGYSWDDTVAYSWKAADSWTTLFPDPGDPTTGIDDDTAITALPFTFPFYEGAAGVLLEVAKRSELRNVT